MVTGSALATGAARDTAQTVVALLGSEASAGHPHLVALRTISGVEDARSGADAVHYLTMLHGRMPGVIDHAATRVADNDTRRAMFKLADAFAAERELLSRLVVAVGPIPSTPGQAETEASVIHQRHAVEMLAQSDRQGCALGAALAVAIDWQAIRTVLDASARRFSVDVAAPALPETDELEAIARAACTSAAIERAFLFGAQQIATQHRALWDLLEARAHARAQY
jgi:hypothetical protein